MSGKMYNGEKAIISLTSWKARINTVGITIFSLLRQCPGFHIVLVLSEEEFPKKEAELPKDLCLMEKSGLIEILWVYRNYKSFKKVLFTMDKYQDVPVISADDDCVYRCNYAEQLYGAYLTNKTSKCRIGLEKVTRFGITLLCGYGTLFAPNVFSMFNLSSLDKLIEYNLTEDDMLYGMLSKKYDITTYDLGYKQQTKNGITVVSFHDTNEPLSDIRSYDSNSDYYKLVPILNME